MAWASNVIFENQWAGEVPLNSSIAEGPGTLTDFASRDEALAFFRSAGYTGVLEDMLYQYLLDAGMTPATRQDMLHEYDADYYGRNPWVQGVGPRYWDG